MGIKTIEDLATFNPNVLLKVFGKYGNQMYEYANGIENSEVETTRNRPKSISQEETLAKDVNTLEDIYRIICKLTNDVTYKLRKEKMKANVVCVDLRTTDFRDYSHQKKLGEATSSTKIILEQAKKSAEEMYTGEPIRQIGVKVDKLVELSEGVQISLLSGKENIRQDRLDQTLDNLSKRYGGRIIKRGILD